MGGLMRFFARCATGAGFVALGADALYIVEAQGRPPYTLAWLGDVAALGESMPVLAAAAGTGSPLGALPVSLTLLWLGAVLFVANPRRR